MPSTCQIELPSDPHLLGVMRTLVEKWCQLAGFPEDVARRLTLGVDEAMANIIRHAYAGCPTEKIVATLSRDDHAVTFVLEDSGAPVDRSQICRHPPDELRPGGRGTHFIRETMDEVEYLTLPSRNRIRLVKYRPRPDSAGRRDG